MREPGIDTTKIKQWAGRVTPRDLVWQRDTVNLALTTNYDLIEFIGSALKRSKDPDLNGEMLARLVAEFTAEEITWFCDNYKRPPQHEKRKAAGERSGRIRSWWREPREDW